MDPPPPPPPRTGLNVSPYEYQLPSVGTLSISSLDKSHRVSNGAYPTYQPAETLTHGYAGTLPTTSPVSKAALSYGLPGGYPGSLMSSANSIMQPPPFHTQAFTDLPNNFPTTRFPFFAEMPHTMSTIYQPTHPYDPVDISGYPFAPEQTTGEKAIY